MNNDIFKLKHIPERTTKPRESGLTMVMDKGMSLRETEDFLHSAQPHTDIVKLGFGTSFCTPNLEEKIKLYRSHGMKIYFGGTLFEAYVARNQFEDYIRILNHYGMEYAEVSDGSIELDHDEKCEYIHKLAKHVTVLSEVGSKDADKIIPPYQWIEWMEKEVQAGVWKVIAESRESGTVGIFRKSGEIRTGLIAEIIRKIPQDMILWEAPIKAQQVWFINLYGPNVNLGNIAPSEVVALETLRVGLRGDSFHFFLPEQA